MSGSKDILIEQLRAEVERLRDDRAELQERCNRLSAEKTEALRMLADAEDLANAANAIQTTDALKAAESEIDALRRQLASRTEAIQTSLATTRELRERAERAERERDEARANYAFMVERAADQKLDGYREPGARAAAAEERAERAERERDEWKRSAESQNRQWSAKYMEATELRARAKKAESERDALRHHYDKAGPEHNLLALLDMYDEWRVAAESERDEARAERDARPNISAYDAAIRWTETREGVAASARIEAALDAHAAKAVKP